jgi:hypothetical protein
MCRSVFLKQNRHIIHSLQLNTHTITDSVVPAYVPTYCASL